ncbi:hypothetical protein C8039_12700 [Halogeometricum sp. wsp3]|nr:hypothetical protein C8039_12700 [Halogeometricum sp. wsp3]
MTAVLVGDIRRSNLLAVCTNISRVPTAPARARLRDPRRHSQHRSTASDVTPGSGPGVNSGSRVEFRQMPRTDGLCRTRIGQYRRHSLVRPF